MALTAAAVIVAAGIGVAAVASGDVPGGIDRPAMAEHQHVMSDRMADHWPDQMAGPMGHRP